MVPEGDKMTMCKNLERQCMSHVSTLYWARYHISHRCWSTFGTHEKISLSKLGLHWKFIQKSKRYRLENDSYIKGMLKWGIN